MDDISSVFLAVTCGVPQSSVLDPTLFLLYINDLCNVSQLLKFILFADDTNIFLSGTDVHYLCRVMCEELVKLENWFRLNKLSLNVNATNYVVFFIYSC